MLLEELGEVDHFLGLGCGAQGVDDDLVVEGDVDPSLLQLARAHDRVERLHQLHLLMWPTHHTGE